MSLDEKKGYYKNLLQKIMKRNTILAGLFAGTIGGGLYFNYGNMKYFWFDKDFKKDEPFDENPQYIEIIDRKDNPMDYISPDANAVDNKLWSWWKHQPITNKQIHWKLLKLSNSKNKHVRHLALTGLVELPGLNDAECREIAQACGFQTAIELAKINGVDQRLFLPPPRIPQEFHQNNLTISMKILLSNLPKETQDDCAKFFTDLALGIVFNEDEGGIWRIWGEKAVTEGESAVQYPKRTPSDTSIITSLRAILSHSLISIHRDLIIKFGGLQLMQRAVNESANAKNHLEISAIIGKIIGNLALEPGVKAKIFSAGWVGILAKWFHSESHELSLIAARALANLSAEEDSEDPVFEDGIYILHPINRKWDSGSDLDIVFIHGLLGGVFRTWRQQDNRKPSELKKKSNPTATEELLSAIQAKFAPNYTSCWPKDWLPKDVKRIRILAVDYESNLSDWRTQCPIRGKMNTLEGRSKDMLEKLTKAGIGNRPVVWVSHSMGGLIVKQLLLQSQKSSDEIQKNVSKNTKGTVFFSVPHRGSSLAELNASVEFLVKPSVEVQELKDRQRLREMHDSFLELAEDNHIACLSFGETKKTNVGLKWNLLVVPPDLADPGIGKYYTLPVNHLNTCKPFDNSSSNYILLVEFLKDVIEKNDSTR